MAWSEQCKVAFEMTVIAKQHTGEKKRSLNAILKEVAQESGIPKKTLERWWNEAQKAKFLKNEEHDISGGNNDQSLPKDTSETGRMPMCRNGCDRSVYTDPRSGLPYKKKSKYHGVCGPCRSKMKRSIKKHGGATPESGLRVFCPKCGHEHYVLTPN